MYRPVSRGEVACSLLLAVLPREEDQFHKEKDLDADRLLAEVRPWCQEQGGKSPEELAIWYLNHGNHDQQAEALEYLVGGGTTGAVARLETYLLAHAAELGNDHNERSDYANIASEYLHRRGRAGLPFVRQLEAAAFPPRPLAERTAALDAGRAAAQDEHLRALLNVWRTAAETAPAGETTESPPAREILARVARQPAEWGKDKAALEQQLDAGTTAESLQQLLRATAGMQDLRVRQELLALLGKHLYLPDDKQLPPAAGDPGCGPALAAFFLGHAKEWLALLSDDRKMPAAPEQNGPDTFAKATMSMIWNAFHGRSPLIIDEKNGRSGRPGAGACLAVRPAVAALAHGAAGAAGPARCHCRAAAGDAAGRGGRGRGGAAG